MSQAPIDTELLQAVPFDEPFLDHSWEWLCDLEVKELTGTPAFTKADQLAWFKTLPAKSDYLIWGISFAGRPIGVFGLKAVTSTDAEYWGYIGEKDFWGRGVGNWMMDFARVKARELGLERLYLRVLPFNERAIRLYEKHGFRPKGTEGQAVIMFLELQNED